MTTRQNHLIKMEFLKTLYIRHCRIFGKISEERYQGVLDGLDMSMEIAESIKSFEKDIKKHKEKVA